MRIIGAFLFGLGVTLAIGGGCGSVTTSSTTGSSSTGGGVCSGFEDQSGKPVTLHFKNMTAIPIYLPGACNNVDYQIQPKSGPDGISYLYDLSCYQTCQQLQSEPGIACEVACQPNAHKVDPGATFDVVWPGTGLENVMMPSSCFFQSPTTTGTRSCGQIVTPKDGAYRIIATATDGCGPNCTCDSQGNCSQPVQGATANADEAIIDVPVTTDVDVVFNTCAFGCANP